MLRFEYNDPWSLWFELVPEYQSRVDAIVPQWSPQNRPTVVRAKPANGRGRGLSCSTLQPPVEASLFSYANSADRILVRVRDAASGLAWRWRRRCLPATSPSPPPVCFEGAEDMCAH